MTENHLQVLFWKEFYKVFDLIIPNYRPKNWHECDLFCLSKQGLFYEFEIKLTVADFKNDFNKYDSKIKKYKHERIEVGDKYTPAGFSYLTPHGLLRGNEVPDYAGLFQITDGGAYLIETVKTHTHIHDNPVSDEVINHARDKAYLRMWDAKERLRLVK